MDSLYLLIPIALVLLGIAIRFLFWAVKSGQYEDLDTEAHRILFDDDLQPPIDTSPRQHPEEDITAAPGEQKD